MVGAVMQDDHLFAGSIADNISLFDATASQEDVESAARMAVIHEEICALPMGYRTAVGDMEHHAPDTGTPTRDPGERRSRGSVWQSSYSCRV
jgi:ABC-type protease/lipase transport system fused ATPase/permease subunit